MKKSIIALFIAILMIPSVSFAQTPVQDRETILQIIQVLLVRIQELQAQQANLKKDVKEVKKQEEKAGSSIATTTEPVLTDTDPCWSGRFVTQSYHRCR